MYNVNKTECNYLQTVFKDNGCTNQSCATQSGETRPILDWEMIELFKDAPLILDHDTVTCYQLTQLPVECSKQVLELFTNSPSLVAPILSQIQCRNNMYLKSKLRAVRICQTQCNLILPCWCSWNIIINVASGPSLKLINHVNQLRN